ncbi:LysR family transcriptional regulator [Vibrio plantisponsor]|uniref:LysR family transcriptional regulator n=2 Tax=Gammaproteobacteria TaxID=1236 RepID=A0ABU4IKQ6_9VIBR|nr:LysR family transcriptional regulator [Vibrio plantisponsor]MDW6019141.1 LysR family transcriptional regulator [Vibrio plantisponsor]NNM41988.1 LysR family transcriptional regulator [Vibrio plantisponsor]
MHDLTSMRAFEALQEHKSLTAAAKALNQPKSTVSRRLAQLEADIGQALTVREGNRLTLTKAGQVFARYSKQMLEIADESYDAIQGLNNKVSGELTIVCHPALMRGWLNNILNMFLSDNPKVRVRLKSETASNSTKPDLVIWLGEYPDLEWRKQTLGQWRYGVYASPDYLRKVDEIQHPQDLNGHPWIDFGSVRKTGVTISTSDQRTYYLEPMKSRFESDNLVLQIDSIANGHGIGLLPDPIAAGYSKHHPNRIVECLSEWKTGTTDINYYVQKGLVPRRLLALLDLIETNVPSEWITQ